MSKSIAFDFHETAIELLAVESGPFKDWVLSITTMDFDGGCSIFTCPLTGKRFSIPHGFNYGSARRVYSPVIWNMREIYYTVINPDARPSDFQTHEEQKYAYDMELSSKFIFEYENELKVLEAKLRAESRPEFRKMIQNKIDSVKGEIESYRDYPEREKRYKNKVESWMELSPSD